MDLPQEHLDLAEVFTKSTAAGLPPHRSYAIDLLPGMTPPNSSNICTRTSQH